MKLPSPKASGSILLIIFLSTSLITYSNYKEGRVSGGEVEVATEKINIDTQINNTNKDSDEDGLLDWEESIWGTDPNNPDTDGDGTNDNEEINNDRNPLLAGPDDRDISFEEKAIERILENNLDKNGLTNQVAESFADDYFNARANGKLTQEDKDQLINQITKDAFEEINIEGIYTIDSIETFNPVNNGEKLITYADLLIARQINALAITISVEENTDYEYLGNEIIKISSKIVSIETPQQIDDLHLYLANNYYKLGVSMKNFEREKEDPLYSLLSIKKYEEAQNNIKDINIQINNFLKENGIILGDNGIDIQND
jgi:hypothetical protein